VKRTILLAFVAALALAIGLSSVAIAGQDGAAVSAKKSKGKKGKRCKSKSKSRGRGKGRNKARRPASVRRKSKGRGCKGGGANWLEPGQYEGQGGLASIEIRSRTRVRFGADRVCPVFLSIEVEDAKLTANKLTAVYAALPGQKGILKRMSLVVTSDYRYKLVIETSDIGANLSCKPSATFEGKLKKVG